jgi:predicted SnoaL-like aldol condensation-catalyzing enzyme
MSTEANKEIFRNMIEEFWNKKRLDTAAEFFSADTYSPSVPWLQPGPDGVKMFAGAFLAAFPDLQITIDMIVASGDMVAGRLVQKGTHSGELMGIPASGKTAEFTEMAICKIVDGKIAVSWYQTDMLSLMQQIGAIPS